MARHGPYCARWRQLGLTNSLSESALVWRRTESRGSGRHESLGIALCRLQCRNSSVPSVVRRNAVNSVRTATLQTVALAAVSPQPTSCGCVRPIARAVCPPVYLLSADTHAGCSAASLDVLRGGLYNELVRPGPFCCRMAPSSLSSRRSSRPRSVQRPSPASPSPAGSAPSAPPPGPLRARWRPCQRSCRA